MYTISRVVYTIQSCCVHNPRRLCPSSCSYRVYKSPPPLVVGRDRFSEYSTPHTVLQSVCGRFQRGYDCSVYGSYHPYPYCLSKVSGKMKPKSASDVLRQLSPRKVIGTSFFTGNRFNSLRDISPAASTRSISSIRDRSVSAKRKHDESASYSAVAGGGGREQVGIPLRIHADVLNTKLAKVRSVCDQAASAISVDNVDPAIVAIFGNILEALQLTCDLQADIISNLPGSDKGNAQYSGVVPKKSRQDSNLVLTQKTQVNPLVPPRIVQSRQVADNEDVDPRIFKFRESVKQAEKSTLLLNLDLGKVPIMNQNTISTKATGALTAMAAAAEGKNGIVPSEDTVTAIDDVLSMVNSMQFYGKSTKTYKNPKDPKSGAYCTIPVKYEFKDRDTRIRAETLLREKCKVHCSTPYPTILRETIRQVVNYVKKDYPDNQVRVNVDLKNLGLKVGRRPPAEAGAPPQYWKDYTRLIPLPPEVFDVSARSVPLNFVVRDLPDTPEKQSRMAVDKSPVSSPSSRQSRKDSHVAVEGGGGGSPK